MEIARSKGMRGIGMCQRVEGDLLRLMNSAWLNLDEYIDYAERLEKLSE